METINKPIVKKYSKEHRGTTITFTPNYKSFHTNISADYKTLEELFLTRLYYAKLYTSIDIKYNGQPIECTHKDFANMLFGKDFVYTQLDKSWSIIVGQSNTNQFQCMSIMNGIFVSSGTHIDYIKNQIVDNIKDKAERAISKYKKFNKGMLTSCMFIVIIGTIKNPQFVGQTKDKLTNEKKEYTQFIIPNSTFTKIWKLLEYKLIDNFLAAKGKKEPKTFSVSGIKKYKPAKYSGKHKNSLKCSLLICEGDSAESMTRTCLTSPSIDMNYNYYGTFNIQGVPINSRTKTNVVRGRFQRTKQLLENERLDSLQKVLNLDFNKKYETKEELSTLSYGQVIICVDQDLDGIGQIFGLIMSHIELFWPALIKNGFIKQLSTPIIRAYKGKNSVSFYTDKQYDDWSKNKDLSKYKICYYKGLATHNDVEAIDIFSKFNSSLCEMVYDDHAKQSFNIYYGKEPDLRKNELKHGITDIDNNINKRSCTVHLKVHTKAFQLDNIKRKLPCIYDGLNPARRKVLCGSIKKFTSDKMETKVFQLSGYIAETMNYHHGSASLEKTIINMAQDYVGANNIPLLLPLSQFGSRFSGGKDHGAARYIKTTLNRKLVSALFRRDDDYILEYNKDEGQINEPIYYCPIAPYVLLESLEVPATGWKYAGYARKWEAVYKNIINLIDSDGKCDITKLPFWKNKWTGYTRKGRFVGRYSCDKKSNTVTIHELPYRVWNDTYVESLLKKKEIDTVDDLSSKLKINIVIKYKKNKYPSDVDSSIGMYKSMNKNLNFIDDKGVLELENYKDVLIAWYIKRKEMYKLRIERLSILVSLRIKCLEEIIKFVKNDKYDFSKIDEKKAVSILKKDGYTTFNKYKLDNPGFIDLKDMKELIITKGSYDYLLNINARQKLKKARDSRDTKLKSLKEYYKKLTSKDAVKTIWKEELAELNSIIKE